RARAPVGGPDAGRRARRDAELGGDDVDARHPLRDRVLDLHARVHLEEVEAPLGVEQELDRARARVTDGARRGEGGGGHLGTETRGEHRARRLLDDLLVAALDRALALPEMDERTVAVAAHLHLDVAGTDAELPHVAAPDG